MSQNVSPKKMRAVLALCESGSISAAAERAGVNRKTLGQWLKKDVDFQQALQEARTEFMRHGTSRICGLIGKAVDAIASALAGVEIDKNQFLSARFVVETALAIQEQDLDLRVGRLEERVRQGQYERQQQLDSRTDAGARRRRTAGR